MSNNSGFSGLFTDHLGALIVVVVVTALVVFSACFLAWYNFGGGAWRGGVGVHEALMRAPDRLELIVGSCNGNPSTSGWGMTDDAVQIKVVAYSTPLHGGDECQDALEFNLPEPLGNRIVLDLHTGRTVSVRTVR